MFIIFRRFNDPVGDGVRAELLEVSDRETALAQFAEHSKNEETVFVSLYEATIIYSYTPDSEARTLNSDDLRTSAIEGVDNLSDKEGV